MDEYAARNEMKVMVAIDLAAICKKLAENPAVPDGMRVQARELVGEWESQEHFLGEKLFFKMTRFLEGIQPLQSYPSVA